MVALKKILIFFVVCSTIICTHSLISIDIDAFELQCIGEHLVESYFHHNLIQRKVSVPRSCLSSLKKILIGVLQMIGVTGSLIAANIYTPWFEFLSASTTTTTPNANNITLHGRYNNPIVPSKICPNDYGCDRNACWRTCENGEKEKDVLSWCYTTTKPGSHQYARCIYPHDCSGCWECLGRCHSKRN